LSKKKSASKPINTPAKLPSRKAAVAKSKAKKSAAVNSTGSRGQQAKPPRAKVSTTKTKKKKTSKKTVEKNEKDVGNLMVEETSKGLSSDFHLRPSSDRLKVLSTSMDGASLSVSDRVPTETAGMSMVSTLKVLDSKNSSQASIVTGSSSWERQQARADERRLEVERKRTEKRRLQMEQQREEEEKIRLLVSLDLM